jgi:hypothetical protein
MSPLLFLYHIVFFFCNVSLRIDFRITDLQNLFDDTAVDLTICFKNVEKKSAKRVRKKRKRKTERNRRRRANGRATAGAAGNPARASKKGASATRSVCHTSTTNDGTWVSPETGFPVNTRGTDSTIKDKGATTGRGSILEVLTRGLYLEFVVNL